MKKFFTLFFALCIAIGPLKAQWKAYTPVLADTVGGHDLRVAHGNNQIAWSINMKYAVTPPYAWIETTPTLFFTKTKDGGETWTGDTLPMGPEPFASNICPITDQLAWASGVDVNFASHVVRTTDGGATWQRVMTDKFVSASSYVNFVHFWDEKNGIAIGDPAPSVTDTMPFFEIYRTSDGGTTWDRVPSANIPLPNNEYGSGGQYDVRGDHVWFAAIDGGDFAGKRIYHSKNRGQTWEVLDPPNTRFTRWSFVDSLHGLVVNPRAAATLPFSIHYTADGGVTWTKLPPFNPSSSGVHWSLIPQSYFIMNSRRTNAVTGPFVTYLSKDLGQSWLQIPTNENVAVFYFSSPTIGYGAEAQPADHPTRMYKYNGDPLTGLLSGKPLTAAVYLAPNPASEVLTVTVQSADKADYLLFINDIQGQLIEQVRILDGTDFSKSFDVSRLPAGVYTLTVSSPQGHLTRSFVKK